MLWALLMIAPPAEGGLTWEAPAGCPTAQDVEAGVDRLLAVEGAPRLAAEGAIVEKGAEYELTVRVGDETRVVTANTCAPLGTVAALVIAVAHDPIAVVGSIASKPDDAASGRRETAGDDGSTEVQRDATRDRQPKVAVRPATHTNTRRVDDASAHDRSVRAGVAPLLAVGGGELPGGGVGFGLGIAAFGRAWWRVELAGAGWLPRHAEARDAPEFGADLWMIGGSLRGCGVPRASAVEFPICVGAELDAWFARGRGPGITGRRDRTQLYAAAVVSAGVAVRLRPWVALGARAELLASLWRPAVHIDGPGFVFRAFPVGGRLVLGPEFRFP
jgi:hypothetical protein